MPDEDDKADKNTAKLKRSSRTEMCQNDLYMMERTAPVNSLPNEKISAWSKLKAFAEDKIDFVKNDDFSP